LFQVIASGGSCRGVTPAKCLVELNNLILTINASSGFFIYCFVGTFGTQFVKALHGCCRNYDEVNNQGQYWMKLFPKLLLTFKNYFLEYKLLINYKKKAY